MSAHSPIDIVLTNLESARDGGAGKWTAKCPAHDDRKASLSVTEGDDGRVLMNCFAGCEVQDVVAALGLEMRDLFRLSSSMGEGGSPMASKSGATPQHPASGCTLAQYAEAKNLPVDLLRALGLSDITYLGATALRIPYIDEGGSEGPVQFRLAIKGEARFKWRKGSKPTLYGLSRLHQAREAGYVVLVEGTSDCHTSWHNGIPAIGVPGANMWREERDAHHLEDIPVVYTVIEPDKGGETLLGILSASIVRDRLRIVRLGDFKDLSDMYVDDPDEFKARWRAALERSRPWAEVASEQTNIKSHDAWEVCQTLAQCPRVLDRLTTQLKRHGVVGEERSCKLLYLIVCTRFLDHLVSAVVKGPSSSGKSWLVERVLDFFPADAYYTLSAMSERALAYSEEPVEHRFIVVYEAAGLGSDFASYLIRSLLSEGRIRYETVEKTSDGLQARLIERKGPTGLIVTTTAAKLHAENETRLLSIPVSDTSEQTAAIMEALAEEDDGRGAASLNEWHALQAWLDSAEHRVTVPFGHTLSKMVPPVAVRLRRDFGAVLNLIRAHAIIHQATRQRDGDGRIIADIENDYAEVRELISDLVSEGVDATVSPAIREAVGAVRDISKNGSAEASIAKVALKLKIDKSSAYRRLAVARDLGYVRNLEDKRGRPWRLVQADPLPDEMSILPTPAELRDCCSVAVKTGGEEGPPPPGEMRL